MHRDRDVKLKGRVSGIKITLYHVVRVLNNNSKIITTAALTCETSIMFNVTING